MITFKDMVDTNNEMKECDEILEQVASMKSYFSINNNVFGIYRQIYTL